MRGLLGFLLTISGTLVFLGCDSPTRNAATEKATFPDLVYVKKHMQPAQLALGEAVVNSVGMVLIPIPAGDFLMGGDGSIERPYLDHSIESELPQHKVRITKNFYLGATEVTQQQWEAVMKRRPWEGQDYVKERPSCPATFISWEDAAEFCERLGLQENASYRLPTEAEWEFACRAGTTERFSCQVLGEHAWYGWSIDNEEFDLGKMSLPRAREVGTKHPNPWGLYDMHGNVWEWCQDWFDYDYYQRASEVDPAGPSAGKNRVVRGGSWANSQWYCRSSGRYYNDPNDKTSSIGFRVVLTAVPQPLVSESPGTGRAATSGEPFQRGETVVSKSDRTPPSPDGAIATQEEKGTSHPTSDTESQMRTWTDSTGDHKTEAAFLALKDVTVILKRDNGQTFSVAIERLSEVDKEWVRQQVIARERQ